MGRLRAGARRSCSSALERRAPSSPPHARPRSKLRLCCAISPPAMKSLCRLPPSLPAPTGFRRRQAPVKFVATRRDTLNIDETQIEAAIGPRTRAIVPVHYAGVGCEMDAIMSIAAKHGLVVVEDAAQGVNATYQGRFLGTIGDMGCYSFHESKNFVAGEGGAFLTNDPD